METKEVTVSCIRHSPHDYHLIGKSGLPAVNLHGGFFLRFGIRDFILRLQK